MRVEEARGSGLLRYGGLSFRCSAFDVRTFGLSFTQAGPICLQVIIRTASEIMTRSPMFGLSYTQARRRMRLEDHP